MKILRFNAISDVRLAAGAGEDSNVRPFEMVAYSGGKLFVNGFPAPVVVDLGGVVVKANDGSDQSVPVTLDHDDSKRVGHTETVKVGFNQIMMAGHTSAETEARDEVVSSARNGYRWAASIEGHVRESQVVKAGQSRVINGQRHEGPFIHAKRFVLRKVSFVTSGGDENNEVSLAAESGDVEMDPKFKEWLEAKAFDPAVVEENDSQCQYLMAQWKSETATPPPPAPVVPSVPSNDDIIDVAEKMRLEAAETAETIGKLKTICGENTELFAQAMKENWSEDKTALECLRASREQATPAIHVDDSKPDSKVLEASLLRSGGMLNEDDYSAEVLEASDKHRGYGLHALMHDCIRAAGKSYKPGCYDNEFIRTAFEADGILKASSGFSTLSLSGILSNIANKSLLSSYQNVPGVIETISATRDVNDFKTVTMYRLTGSGKLLKLGPDGEIKHTEFDEESYTNQIATYARMAGLTRQMQINDDLGAFLQIPSTFGRQAALTLEKTGFTVLLAAINGGAFFTSGRGNLVPATAPLDVTNLTTAEKLFDEQVDGNTADGATVGDPVLLRGQYLLVPPALGVTARTLMNSQQLMVENNDTDHTAAATLIGVDNPHAGAYTPVKSPYFGTKHSITGGLDTHWLIIANPSDSPMIEIARLRGQRSPVMESAETDFNTLGMQWRIYMDFGIAMQDYRAGVYSTGVA